MRPGPNACCGLAVIFCGFISLLIGRETINIPEIFSGFHGFTGKTKICQEETTETQKGNTFKQFTAECNSLILSLIDSRHVQQVNYYVCYKETIQVERNQREPIHV